VPFIGFRGICTSESDVTVAELSGMADFTLRHYINQYARYKQRTRTYLIYGSYVSRAVGEDRKRRQCI